MILSGNKYAHAQDSKLAILCPVQRKRNGHGVDHYFTLDAIAIIQFTQSDSVN